MLYATIETKDDDDGDASRRFCRMYLIFSEAIVSELYFFEKNDDSASRFFVWLFYFVRRELQKKKGKIYDIFVIDFPNDCTYVKECLA